MVPAKTIQQILSPGAIAYFIHTPWRETQQLELCLWTASPQHQSSRVDTASIPQKSQGPADAGSASAVFLPRHLSSSPARGRLLYFLSNMCF